MIYGAKLSSLIIGSTLLYSQGKANDQKIPALNPEE